MTRASMANGSGFTALCILGPFGHSLFWHRSTEVSVLSRHSVEHSDPPFVALPHDLIGVFGEAFRCGGAPLWLHGDFHVEVPIDSRTDGRETDGS